MLFQYSYPRIMILLKLVVAGTFAVVLEAVEDVSGMEVVDPVQVRFLAVPPRAVRPLILSRVLHSPLRQRPIVFVAPVSIGPRQQAPPSVFALCTWMSDRHIAYASALRHQRMYPDREGCARRRSRQFPGTDRS